MENQQHEKEVPRLTRSADLGGKRDNSGNRREVKKKKKHCEGSALVKTITKIGCSEKQDPESKK